MGRHCSVRHDRKVARGRRGRKISFDHQEKTVIVGPLLYPVDPLFSIGGHRQATLPSDGHVAVGTVWRGNGIVAGACWNQGRAQPLMDCRIAANPA